MRDRIPSQTTAADHAAAACCGEKRAGECRPETAGQPLIPACQLCPKSPTYWRKEQPA